MAAGISYVSEDRLGQSLVMDFPILANASLPVIRQATFAGLVRRRSELVLVQTPAAASRSTPALQPSAPRLVKAAMSDRLPHRDLGWGTIALIVKSAKEPVYVKGQSRCCGYPAGYSRLCPTSVGTVLLSIWSYEWAKRSGA